MYDIMEPSESKHKISVGIDFGTTNSLIAAVLEGKCIVVPDSNGKKLLPSVVAYDGDEVVVGFDAITLPGHIRSIKRIFGQSSADFSVENSAYRIANKISDYEGGAVVNLGHVKKMDVEVASEIIKALKSRAEAYLSCEVKDAVITVPTYFDDAARNSVRNAAILAGFNVMRLINEPTSAAYAYGLDQVPEGVFLVYDLGGGTFDVSILRIEKGVFEVIATSGDRHLGGDDLDYAIAEFLLQKKGLDISNMSPQDIQYALLNARKIKEHLSYNDAWNSDEENIDRIEFIKLIKPIVDKTISILQNAISEAGGVEIDKVILVGGATRVPYIKERIAEKFSIIEGIDPEEIVVRGAAMKADALLGGIDGGLLIDVTPLSLGIELADGVNEIIIPRNTPIPAMYTHHFSTARDNQTGFIIHVLQGESGVVSECRSLAKFHLKNLPSLPAGAVKLQVTFQIDADGILTVTAKELETNKSQYVVVKPSYGLDEQEMIRLGIIK